MNGEKDGGKSVTIWAVLVMALVFVNDKFQLGLDEILRDISEDPEKLALYVTTLAAFWGRLRAKTRITSFFGWKFVKEEPKE